MRKINNVLIVVGFLSFLLSVKPQYTAELTSVKAEHTYKVAVEVKPPEVEVEPVEVETVTAEPELISLGTFKLTAYCSCAKCCGKWAYNRPNGVVKGASGRELIAGYSIAVDTRIIPYGTEVIIDGNTYRADDCGGAIKGNRIDIYYSRHDDCKKNRR